MQQNHYVAFLENICSILNESKFSNCLGKLEKVPNLKKIIVKIPLTVLYKTNMM